MQSTFKTAAFLFLVLVAVPTAHAQDTSRPISVTSDLSNTKGLFLNVRSGGYGMAYEDNHEGTGGGLGLRLGYGFSELFTLYLGVEGAEMSDNGGFEGLPSDEKYGIAHIDLGGRFHFRRDQKLVPFADAAVTVVGMGYESDATFDGKDVTYGGVGFSMGGGLLYFVTPKLALEGAATFTPGGLMERQIGSTTEDVSLGMAGVRMTMGISYYPSR